MEVNQLANRAFEGKVVRKDLVAKIKGGANVPVYVLEYLLGMYCSSDNDDLINEGIT
ncbi:MAG: BREX system Lon protease-like protein BrxL, partial [Fusobacteriaceae bacterium]|nr:BREX system Lon protease-like protein BrxL [Fusobacteriaceae bacterium]